jgi:hypothetical protein
MKTDDLIITLTDCDQLSLLIGLFVWLKIPYELDSHPKDKQYFLHLHQQSWFYISEWINKQSEKK